MSQCLYLDASALVKLYVQEVGSLWIRQLTVSLPPSQLYLSRVAKVEFVSALTRKLRTGEIDANDHQLAFNDFTQDWTHRYTQLEVSEVVLDRAIALVIRCGLRGYDAVHLASALIVNDTLLSLGEQGITFLSADNALLQCAQQEGLRVDNPLNYS
ncbi:MAG: type II toxin-antitoxin system VapC family toxin [Fimbriimonadales bacterium]|nr:type II toxin-antitoxin system VapC family toxin [Fimbriimonadales bacterium]